MHEYKVGDKVRLTGTEWGDPDEGTWIPKRGQVVIVSALKRDGGIEFQWDSGTWYGYPSDGKLDDNVLGMFIRNWAVELYTDEPKPLHISDTVEIQVTAGTDYVMGWAPKATEPDRTVAYLRIHNISATSVMYLNTEQLDNLLTIVQYAKARVDGTA